MKGWLRFQVRLQSGVAAFERSVPWPSILRERRVGATLMVSIAVLVALLLWVVAQHPIIASIVAGLLFLNILAANTAIVFVTRRPRDPFRTTVLTLLSFLQLTLAFAIFYLALPPTAFDPALHSPVQAIYFTAVTFATVGLGDIHPATAASLSQLLVTVQVLVGLYFLAVVLTTIAGFANGSPVPPTLLELLEHSKRLDANASAA
jgi:hypothetical protein